MRRLLVLVSAACPLLMAAGAGAAEMDEYDNEIVVGCHFTMGEWGTAGINVCIEENRAIRKEVEAYPDQYAAYRARCVEKRAQGWDAVRKCLDADIVAAQALRAYPQDLGRVLTRCQEAHLFSGPASVKRCVDDFVESRARCPSDAQVAVYVADYLAKRPSKGFAGQLRVSDAHCARAKVVGQLLPALGPVVGYKAAFTNPALQQRFGVSGPDWGAMFGGMLLESGARVPANFGARPLFEADFAVVVKDAGLAYANTPMDALYHIEAVVPFIELPDLMLEGSFTGAQLIATNVGFRGGVLGRAVKAEHSQAFLDALAGMKIVMTEEVSGAELGRATGSDIMAQPMNAAIWIARALREEGIELKPGDILSLGGYIPPSPTKAGTRIKVQYLGLPGDPSVSVQFD